MLVKRLPRTVKIIASRPSAPTSATEPCAAREKADQENRDLPLQAKKDGVGGLLADKADHRFAVLRIFLRAQIDHRGGVTAQQQILEEKCAGADEGRGPGVKKNKRERKEDDEARQGSGEIDDLDLADVRAQPRDDFQHAERKLCK